MTRRLHRLLRGIPARCVTVCARCHVAPLRPEWNPRGMWGTPGRVGEFNAPDHRGRRVQRATGLVL